MDNSVDIPNLERLALPGRSNVDPPSPGRKPPRHKPGEKFLKGPVPWTWLTTAAQLPGKAIQVGVVVWFLAGINDSRTVTLSNKALRSLGVDRFAQYRGLKALEEAGLVTVIRHAGRNPKVTILDLDERAPANQEEQFEGTHYAGNHAINSTVKG